MASDRDTLADLLHAEGAYCGGCDYEGRCDDCRRIQGTYADAILRAGWRPPARTVTDPAEMDTWPLGTVVRGYGVAHQNVPGHVAGDPPLWIKPTGRLQTSAELLADCRGEGVTVLYQPEEEAACPHDSRSGAGGRWRCDECGADCGPDTYLTTTTEEGGRA